MNINIKLTKGFVFILVCWTINIPVFAQSDQNGSKYLNHVNKENIKTLRAFVLGNESSYPAIELNSGQQMHIEFDDLNTEVSDYSYQLIHCNHDWTTSELFSDEFLNGFNENQIQDYEYSINTKIPYVHYTIDLPNDDVEFLVSGNYVLRVIQNSDRENTILTVRFVVYEPMVNIQTELKRPLGSEFANRGQQIDLTVNHDELSINDPFSEVKVYIAQNNRPDRFLEGLKPVFVKNNELVYNYSGENTLLAGNEFRLIEFNNIHKRGMNVNDVQYHESVYHVQGKLNERRSSKRYLFVEDMNGKYIVNLENSDDSYISADYAWVYFYLPMDDPFLDGSVYVHGALNNWLCNDINKMTYNFEIKMYEVKMLLKQGYYNFTYAFIDNYTYTIDESVIEGSHFQTENDYLIYVYHRDFAQKYDRLVGYKVINSLYKE